MLRNLVDKKTTAIKIFSKQQLFFTNSSDKKEKKGQKKTTKKELDHSRLFSNFQSPTNIPKAHLALYYP